MRTFKEIEQSIIQGLTNRNIRLSTSKVAEWRVWTATFAGVIFAFEQTLNVFRRDVERHSNFVRVGTTGWYATMMMRFQYGHSLTVNPDTYEVYYETEDTKAQLIKHVAVRDSSEHLVIKIATHDKDNKIVPLTFEQSNGVKAYVEMIKFVGTKVRIVSKEPDIVRYNIVAYCNDDADPVVVKENILKSLEVYRSSLNFDAKLYRTKFTNAILNTDDVVTSSINSFERKSYSQTQYKSVGVVDTMDAGYYEYAEDSTLEVKRINELSDED